MEKRKRERLCCEYALLKAHGLLCYSHKELRADGQGKAEVPLDYALAEPMYISAKRTIRGVQMDTAMEVHMAEVSP